jgi:hypothetical protein
MCEDNENEDKLFSSFGCCRIDDMKCGDQHNVYLELLQTGTYFFIVIFFDIYQINKIK